MSTAQERVAVLGASSKPERYSNRAIKMLLQEGHTPLPVSLKETQIAGLPAVQDLTELRGEVDTVTVYVKPAILKEQLQKLLTLHPRRVIFNPGTESPEIAQSLRAAGIQVTEACTLVLLSTGQF